MIKYAILIVTHNHQDTIKKLLESLKNFNYNNIYICDANSNDETKNIIKDFNYKSISLLEKNELHSFSKNVNDLIRHYELRSKYFLILNPDTYFTTDFLNGLLNAMENNEDVVISFPKIYYPDGSLQNSWKKFPSIYRVIYNRLGLSPRKLKISKLESKDVEWALGACLLINSVLLKGNDSLLDERYRLYCEEIDLFFEVHMRKFKILAVEDSFIYHHWNANNYRNFFSKHNMWNMSSIIKFIIKWNFRYFLRFVL